MKEFLDRLSKQLSRIGMVLSCAAILIMTWMIAQNVIMRFVFNRPSEVVEEYSGFLFVFIVFMGLGYVTRLDLHISVPLLFNRLPTNIRKHVNLVTMILNMAVIVVYFIFSIRILVQGFKTGESSVVTLTPLWIPKIFICIGLIIFLFEIINQLIKIKTSFKAPQ
jgi:TRAP-type C4-dicarboxylate transport system permease small subunit